MYNKLLWGQCKRATFFKCVLFVSSRGRKAAAKDDSEEEEEEEEDDDEGQEDEPTSKVQNITDLLNYYCSVILNIWMKTVYFCLYQIIKCFV